MIGVAVRAAEREIAAEFFELFKTPWEFWQSGRQYDVVLSTLDSPYDGSARLVLVFQGEAVPSDGRPQAKSRSHSGGILVSDEGERLPIYGRLSTFPGSSGFLLKEETTQEPAALLIQSGDVSILRIGYDLFSEIRLLLTAGQPVSNANIPTLDKHIAWLRDWITLAGIPSVELPPVPDGYSFIGCLTHDIDHPVLRNHWCDHTMLGFLYRSTMGTALDVCHGKRPFRNLRDNWGAACRLPFIYLGIANDFWADFDRYLEIEKGYGATFFVIPRRDYAGRTPAGPAPAKRACRYEMADILPKLRKIISAGCEVGVHGLDAWLDSEEGRREREMVGKTIGSEELGIRMHWLLFDERSAVMLDQAGFSYDSTVGYRETVGYRAGTTQVYRPPGAERLLELPLHVMDTALFYPSYLNLSQREAERLVRGLVNDVQRFGGVLTVNWHDRSISPERLWDDFYLRLLSEFRIRGAWLPNAALAVAWFRKRRSAAIRWDWAGSDSIRVRGCLNLFDKTPDLKIRVYKPRARSLREALSNRRPPQFLEQRFEPSREVSFPV